MVNGRELSLVESGAHPPRRALAECGGGPEGIELSARLDTDSHQLRFIEHPKAIAVEQAKVHRPAVAAHAVAAVQRAGEQHVLRADEDGIVLGIEIPISLLLATHEDVKADFSVVLAFTFPFPISKIAEPCSHVVSRLLDESAHWQTEDEAARPLGAGVRVWLQHTIPKPRHDDCGSFATAGRDLDELRFASCASAQGLCIARLSIGTAGEAALIGERRRQAGALYENREVVGAAHVAGWDVRRHCVGEEINDKLQNHVGMNAHEEYAEKWAFEFMLGHLCGGGADNGRPMLEFISRANPYSKSTRLFTGRSWSAEPTL